MLRTFPKTQLGYLYAVQQGYEADIKVCSGQNNCFVDPVLFNDKGGEITVLDVEGELLGFYDFGDYKLELKPILQKIR